MRYILLGIVLLTGCGSDKTNREQAEFLCKAYCFMAVNCGHVDGTGLGAQDRCRQACVARVCSGGGCDEEFTGSQDDVRSCYDAILYMSCYAHELPYVCQGVLKK